MVGILALKRPRAPFWFLIQGPSPYLINRSHHTLDSKSQKANPSPFTYVALKNTSSSAHLSNSSPSLRPLPVSLTAVYPFFESLPLANTTFCLPHHTAPASAEIHLLCKTFGPYLYKETNDWPRSRRQLNKRTGTVLGPALFKCPSLLCEL